MVANVRQFVKGARKERKELVNTAYTQVHELETQTMGHEMFGSDSTELISRFHVPTGRRS